MKQTFTEYQFIDQFNKVRPKNFSNKGLKALYNFLIDFEDSAEEELEFDPIALCCDFTEYENLKELQIDYPDIKTLEELENKTTVIKIDNSDGFIIQAF